MTPTRGQKTRPKPWRHLWPDAIDSTRSGRWGNPHSVGVDRCRCGEVHSRAGVVAAYEGDLLAGKLMVPSLKRPRLQHDLADVRRELRGRNLVCSCPLDGGPCHADVQLRIANQAGDADRP